MPTVPYELAERDEKFLQEAAKLIGSPLSDLDMCHQRVILALRKSCATTTAEHLGKLAVLLLNCQSASEQRPLYACTDAMSLAECTQPMDADTWNAYHLMTNRAKAVCVAVRQDQFRGLAELTVNRLMAAAGDQVRQMDALTEGQSQLHEATQQSLHELGDRNLLLLNQQQDMLRVAGEHRSAVADSLHELQQEKALIRAGQLEVAVLIDALKTKLDAGLVQLDAHARQANRNQDELLADLQRLHENALTISGRLEQAMELVLTQSEMASAQYDQTVGRLGEVRATVYDVAEMMAKMQTELEQHMGWMVQKVGGTERFVQKLQLTVQYAAFLLGGMLVLVFVGADGFCRAVFVCGTVAGFAVNYADVGVVALRDVTVAMAAIVLGE